MEDLLKWIYVGRRIGHCWLLVRVLSADRAQDASCQSPVWAPTSWTLLVTFIKRRPPSLVVCRVFDSEETTYHKSNPVPVRITHKMAGLAGGASEPPLKLYLLLLVPLLLVPTVTPGNDSGVKSRILFPSS